MSRFVGGQGLSVVLEAIFPELLRWISVEILYTVSPGVNIRLTDSNAKWKTST